MDLKSLGKTISNPEQYSVLQRLRKEVDFSINEIVKLKKKYPNSPISEMITLINLQRKNSKKNPFADLLIFDQKGIEQSSSWNVAKYHGDKMKPFSVVADLCCGIGIDLIQISEGKKKTIAIDIDEDKLAAAKYNSRKFNRQNIFFLNKNAENFTDPVDALFIDPDRRKNKKRIIDPEDYNPPFSSLLKLLDITPNMLIKLSPAFNYQKLKLPVPHTYEFIQENQTLKEILLCFGRFADVENCKIAVDLDTKLVVTSSMPIKSSINGIKNYLFEPNSAIIRSGLVQQCAYQIKYSRINNFIALLTGDKKIYSQLGKSYEVIDAFPYQKKRLQSYILENNIGILSIKTRGFPIPVEDFRKGIKLIGNEKRVLFLIRKNRGYECIFTQEIKKKLA